MNIARLFIGRPVMTTLVMTGLLVFGVMAYRILPVSDLPNVDFPTIQVTARLPGANPDTMAASVATPLEREFSTIAGIDSMSSSSTLGITRITIQFSLDRSIDAAAQDVQSAIAKAARKLPPDMPTPPTYQKVNPADAPVFYLALASPTLPLSAVNEYADTMIAQRISMLSGVAQVSIYGAKKYAVRVQLDPKAMASREIGIDEVAKAVEQGNVNLPTGTLYGEHQAFNIQARGQLMDAKSFRPLIVSWRNGSAVRLEEIGSVFDSVESDKTITWRNNIRSIVLAIQRQPGTNTVAVVNEIRKLLPVFEKQLPAAVQLSVMIDRSESIRDSVNDVKFTLTLTIGLVILVIFIFLRSLSATLIPSMALPMSIIVTFAAMYLMGFSVDNLSLMALTLAVGFVVDDAIVMLENIVRHLEMGKGVLQAALDGSREISFTIVSMTISLAAVFIPVLFMGGIVGRLFREFSLVITVAILLSGFVSLSLTPMLCSLFLRPRQEVHHGRVYMVTESFFNGMLWFYEKTLKGALRFHWVTFLISVVVLIATVYLFGISPKGFLPSEDIGQIMGFTEASQDISFDSMVRHQSALHEILAAEPAIETYMSSVGAGGPNAAGNSGRFFMRLKPRKTRKESADELIQKLRPKLAKVPGIQAFLMNPPAISIGGRATKGLYQYTLQGPDTAELYRHAVILEKKMKEMSGIQDINSDLQMNNPEIRIDINRDKASSLGITANQIENALQNAYGSNQVSTIYAPTDSYQVIMELLPRYQREPSALSLLYIRSSSGKLVPLDTVATLTSGVGPLSVNHSGQFPSVTISFNLKPEVSLGDAVSEVETFTRSLLPATISGNFQGTAQAFQASFKGMVGLLIMAILVIYIVLGILYESFIHPLTILSGLPSAGFGALLTLYIFKVDLSLYAFVGIIMLIGIVKKNAIMMIDFALEAERAENKSPRDAIVEGCLVRFRPIMMTTMAAIMGTLPIAIGFGAGAESRRPLGLAVVGGLVFSQLLTLYITPVYYIYLDTLKNKVQSLFAGRVREAL
ncbi:MAG: efflux RND transporter permease subunit [Deltaproteobacteria bacterium]|nr:efflux RND transporter permease subunit [Deltaproteobacteria bacterium]